MAGFWKNRARIGQKIQYADFKANSGGFRSEIKCLGFFSQTRAIFGQKFEYADFGQNWGFSGEISTKSGIWMKCSHRSHDGFFRTDFRTFRVLSHDFRTTCFFNFFLFRTDFRTFRAFSHGFRTTCFVKVFCLHVSRVFARSSHAVCRPACLCQIRSNSAQIWKNHSFLLAHPKIFAFFAKKTLTNSK